MADTYFSKDDVTKTLIEFFRCSHISETFIKAVVDEIPAADVRPVGRGKWVVKKTHLFDLNDRGEPDMFAFEYEYHNGPHCKKCGRFICAHCEPDYSEQECEKEHFECPFCKRAVLEKENYCPNCGADMREEG
jgi:hypothetical protein